MNELENSRPLSKDAAWPDGLIIRARKPSDAEGIMTLHNLPGYRFGTLRSPHHTSDEIRKGIESQSANTTALVALLGDKIIGDAGLTRLANRRVHVGSIGMGVHDAHVGKGIGRALLGEVLALADNWFNLRRLELTVYTDNEPAIRLYERNGFVTEGHMRQFAFRDGSYVDAYCMARVRP
jgi:L-phenylalanine/L-methionine N-acetyltransferase